MEASVFMQQNGPTRLWKERVGKAGTRLMRLRLLPSALCGVAMLAMSGCHHQARVAYQQAPPPLPVRSYPAGSSTAHHTTAAAAEPAPSVDLSAEASNAPRGFFDEANGRPVYTETGMASWYGTVYHNRAAADGTTFDQNEMTAAHRTLPMGSTVRVTNLATGQQVLVRITDRGPFAPGRVLDLSMGAAKAVGVYRAGVAKVRIEAFAHTTTDPAGKWCVQTGGFKSQDDALALKAKLLRRYSTAKVIEFAGPTGYWVRIDPSMKTKLQASEIAEWIGEPRPEALPYLVRLD
jgi:rare lipoprotein A